MSKDLNIDVENLTKKGLEVKDKLRKLKTKELKSKKDIAIYDMKRKDFGLNVIANLSVGNATSKRKNRTFIDDYERNINQILLSSNGVLILDGNLFTNITPSNEQEVLTYEEQLAYLITTLKPIKNRILAIKHFGNTEQSIYNKTGLDLMKMLAIGLGVENTLMDEVMLNLILRDENRQKVIVSIKGFDQPTRARTVRNLRNNVNKFKAFNPNFNITFETNSKTNAFIPGVNTQIINGHTVSYPTYHISFGPYYQYDEKNFNKPLLNPYTINCFWSKISFSNNPKYNTKNGEPKFLIEAEPCDYYFPHTAKDETNYLASEIFGLVKGYISNDLNNTIKHLQDIIEDFNLEGLREVRRQLNKNKELSPKKHKQISKINPKKIKLDDLAKE